ncbi:guanine nucleotide-binding protein G(o) subunit alpha-like isoform X3 [Pomacea canaliculata]|uniref:guanine nucleotide-binding protein G(o) subunit alpha-like isoform X3 n=1 Tax=Pomacea canaliculata TaxID=400727 RepID=UPI000D73E371|nr:guanine nucleotide-binding protein G(o) subunit alpha-like isoform X3 [Pomacea canaliculata]
MKTLTLANMNKGGRAAIARSKSIDQQLDEERERRQKEVQLLMLGGAGAGKSTFIKQLRLHYGNHFPEAICHQWVPQVLHNLTGALHVVLEQMEVLNIQFDNHLNKQLAVEFQDKFPRMSMEALVLRFTEEDESAERTSPTTCRADVTRRMTFLDKLQLQAPDVAVLQQLWTDLGVQCCYARRQKFQRHALSRTHEYFLDQADRLLTADYVPTVQDILYVHWPTLGVQEHAIAMDSMQFKMIDVAGQKSLRKKWIHFFEGVTAVIFFASLCGFDEALEEDPATNMLQDSLQTFHEVSHSHFLEKTDIILFLNKKDIFLDRIKTVSLATCFPSYKGSSSPEVSLRFIKEQFLQNKPGHKQLYIHISCAVDINLMRHILANVLDIIMEINLRRTQLQ